MRICVCKFSGNQQFPILLNESGVPYFLPLTFTVLSLKGKAYKTKCRYLYSIEKFYKFFKSKNIDIENEIISRNHRKLFDKSLDEFIAFTFLHSRPDMATAIQNFILWSLSRYSQDPEYNTVILSRFSLISSTNVDSTRASYKSLSSSDLASVKELLSLNSPLNPFRPRVRFRNLMIAELLLQTGIRLGELLKLKVDDFIHNEDRYYLRIANHANDPEDSRTAQPSNKNNLSFRSVAISLDLYEMTQAYIQHFRRPQRSGKKMKLFHSYFLVSDRGTPLSMVTVQSIFTQLQMKIRQTDTGKKEFCLSPHVFRHTFADRFLCFLLEIKKLDMENAKDELRIICGWSPSSTMPSRYANRYINSSANNHNMDRIKNFSL